jgi:hypothetical protein
MYPANNGAEGGDLIAGKLLDRAHTTQLLQVMFGSPISRACSLQHRLRGDLAGKTAGW